MGDRSGAGSVCPKAFLLWAKDFAGLYIVRREDDNTCGPKLVDNVGHCDGLVVVQ